MNRNNSRILLVKAASFLGVAGLSVLISLPGFSQQSPGNATPSVPSTVKPTNPGGQDAGTTNGGERLDRVPSSGNQVPAVGNDVPSNGSMDSPNSGTFNNPDPINRVEGRDQGTLNQMDASPNRSNSQRDINQPGANQPGATTGGDSIQQVERQNGSMQQGGSMQPNRTRSQSDSQSNPQPSTSQSDTNSGTTDSQSTSQQEPTSGSVRALW